ncbi:hypothetical protein [Cupriavidus pauculus]|uniref:hypothetical protein n=1 Tax=Cupriavidus pauculus TaxID=82633 RepID=UPI001D0C7CC0|nr:hypothetical protein [Cupriavidus pauculus]
MPRWVLKTCGRLPVSAAAFATEPNVAIRMIAVNLSISTPRSGIAYVGSFALARTGSRYGCNGHVQVTPMRVGMGIRGTRHHGIDGNHAENFRPADSRRSFTDSRA